MAQRNYITIKQVVELRQKKQVTQKWLAKKLNKEATFISKLENGKRRFPIELQKKIKIILAAKKIAKKGKGKHV